MFKSVRELKAFIAWAKKNGAKKVVAQGVEIEFSDIKIQAEKEQITPDTALEDTASESHKEMGLDGSKLFVDDETEENEEETLYWSSPTFKG